MSEEQELQQLPLPGERLRAERERRGLSAGQVGSELHIDLRMLKALESDDYATLGAPIFVKGHLRNYARLLGLDPAELVAQYEAAQQPAEPVIFAQRAEGARVDEPRSRPWVTWVGWVFMLLLGVLLAAWWYYQREGGADFVIPGTANRTEQPLRPALPRNTAQVSVPVDESPEAVAANEGEESITDENAASESTLEPNDERADASVDADQAARPDTAEPATTQPPVKNESTSAQTAPATTPPASEPARPRVTVNAAPALVLELDEESWVEIYDAEGRPILYDLLAAGTRREINASGQLRVFLGNADGAKITVGGEAFNIDNYRRNDSTARFTVNVPAGSRP